MKYYTHIQHSINICLEKKMVHKYMHKCVYVCVYEWAQKNQNLFISFVWSLSDTIPIKWLWNRKKRPHENAISFVIHFQCVPSISVCWVLYWLCWLDGPHSFSFVPKSRSTHTDCYHPNKRDKTIFKSKHLQRKNPLRQSCFFFFFYFFYLFCHWHCSSLFVGLHIMYVCTLCFYLASVDRHLFVFW